MEIGFECIEYVVWESFRFTVVYIPFQLLFEFDEVLWQEKSGPKLKDFAALLDGDATIKDIRARVNKFATSFPMPGFDPKEMKYQDPMGPPESS